MINKSEYPVSLKLRIDWSELDYFGHVNNVSFYKYIQSSRVNYWDQIGLTESHRKTNIGPLLASCKCDFRMPLYFPGEITIMAKVAFIGNTSFSFQHLILNDKGEVAAEGQDIMVMFDFNKNEKVSFPIDLKQKIEALEGKGF
ncbi:acyl-CoA thioesterase [Peijinzhouia sedimentorum]